MPPRYATLRTSIVSLITLCVRSKLLGTSGAGSAPFALNSSSDDVVRANWRQVFEHGERLDREGDIYGAYAVFSRIARVLCGENISTAPFVQDGVYDPACEPAPLVRMGLLARAIGALGDAIEHTLHALGVAQQRGDRPESRLAAHVNALSNLAAVHMPGEAATRIMRAVRPVAAWHPLVAAMLTGSGPMQGAWEIDYDAQRMRLEYGIAAVFNDALAYGAEPPRSTLTRATFTLSDTALDALKQRHAGNGERALLYDEVLQTIMIMQRMFELVYSGLAATCVPLLAAARDHFMYAGRAYTRAADTPTHVFYHVPFDHAAGVHNIRDEAAAGTGPTPPFGFSSRITVHSPPLLHVAYVSADMRVHSVGLSVIGLLAAHDAASITHTCYATGGVDRYPLGHAPRMGWQCSSHNRSAAACEVMQAVPLAPVPSHPSRMHAVLHLMHDATWTHTERLAVACQQRLYAFRMRALRETDDVAEAPVGNVSALASHVQQVGRPHIVVDLTGRSAGARPDMWLHPLARIKAAYLGAPTTVGEPLAAHFVLLDTIVQPAETVNELRGVHPACACGSCTASTGSNASSVFSRFSEALVYLPAPYHAVTMHRMDLRSRAVTCDASADSMMGTDLSPGCTSDNSIIFGALHSTSKLEPRMADVWASILRRTGGCAHLWLLRPRGFDEIRLRILDEFVARGVHPARIRFVGSDRGKDSRLDILNIYTMLDVFLDLHTYGAHSTVFDVLVTGVPVLTLMSAEWPGRVAATALSSMCGTGRNHSVCTSFIAYSFQEYEEMAVVLAHDASLRRVLGRQMLSAAGLSHTPPLDRSLPSTLPPFVDHVRRARDLERAYRTMANVDALGEEGRAHTHRAHAQLMSRGNLQRAYMHIVVGEV